MYIIEQNTTNHSKTPRRQDAYVLFVNVTQEGSSFEYSVWFCDCSKVCTMQKIESCEVNAF